MTETIPTDNHDLWVNRDQFDDLVRGIRRDDARAVERILTVNEYRDPARADIDMNMTHGRLVAAGFAEAVLNGYDEHGMAPIHMAALYGRDRIFEMLLNYADCDLGAVTQDNERWTVPGLLCRSGIHRNRRCLALLGQRLGQDADFTDELSKPVNSDNETLLHVAARTGNIDFLEELLLMRWALDVNATDQDGATPLYAAVESNERECVRQLLRRDADPNIGTGDGTTPLMVAAKNAELNDMVELLLRFGADPNQRSPLQRTALHYAALSLISPDGTNISGEGEVGQCGAHVRDLIKHDADVNAADGDGMTPLHYAARSRHMGMVNALFEECASVDIDAEDSAGCTALYYAAAAADPDIVGRLLLEGAATHHQHKTTSQTALHVLAGATCSMDVVKTGKLILVKQGALLARLRDCQGRTPLHLLLSNKSFNARPEQGVELVKLMLAYGSDMSIPDKDGVTAEGLFDEKCNDLGLSTDVTMKLRAIKETYDDARKQSRHQPGKTSRAACGQ